MNFLDVVEINPSITLQKGQLYPFIEMANVGTNCREPLAIEKRVFSSGVKFQDGDSIVARIEPCLQNGKKFYCHDIGTGFGSTEYLVFRPKGDAVDSVYLYYLLQTEYIRKNMINSMTGATGRQRVNNDVFKSIEIDLPTIDTQRKIANNLAAFDDLIENNQKQIKLLEEAAQRLYKEWFVDLRFPGHETTPITDGVPVGWQQLLLEQVAPILTGKKDANFSTEDGKYPFFTCAQTPLQAPSYSFDCDAVILAGNGDFNVKLYRGQFEAYQRTYVLSPENTELLFLLYHAVNNSMAKLAQGASGSTIKFLTKGMIASIPVYVPDERILNKFNELSEAIQKQIEVLKSMVAHAAEARDRLLPKQMNGEIEV